jgi:demethylmenaquinone methyltransferase / 2-methoxy-6-polyprenyl-1,4-benzoquinol methylase
MAVVPNTGSPDSKKKQVAEMFTRISGHYDLLNHLLSFGMDRWWRRKTIRMIQKYAPRTILDVATGTADFALDACRINPEKVIGTDISEGMLRRGRKKIARKNLNGILSLQWGDSENLPFSDHTFDTAITAFGVRNFESLEAGLSEVCRTLVPGGHFFILEFSKPEYGFFRAVYTFYLKNILPLAGRIISGDQYAYRYLHDSIKAFPSGEAFEKIMEKSGFSDIQRVPMTFGIVTVYIGQKPHSFQRIE